MSANPLAARASELPRLRRDAERNRVRILAAAAEAFAERGLAVTMDEIARRAGVGVGTVYRRFPDKELLIDALFEQRIDALVALAETARDHGDAWEGLAHFVERVVAMQAADRGLKEVVLSTAHGQERVARARARIGPAVEDLLERAKAEGGLRPDVVGPDLGLIQFMLGALADSTREIEPELWRRFLTIVLDGLRTRRDAPSPLAPGPLGVGDLDRAMAAWRPPVR
jgi:AcrR family transcriptional regulator